MRALTASGLYRGRLRALDGEIGRVEGFLVDPGDHRVTHVLLREGHLWGRNEVAIPVRAGWVRGHRGHGSVSASDARTLRRALAASKAILDLGVSPSGA